MSVGSGEAFHPQVFVDPPPPFFYFILFISELGAKTAAVVLESKDVEVLRRLFVPKVVFVTTVYLLKKGAILFELL